MGSTLGCCGCCCFVDSCGCGSVAVRLLPFVGGEGRWGAGKGEEGGVEASVGSEWVLLVYLLSLGAPAAAAVGEEVKVRVMGAVLLFLGVALPRFLGLLVASGRTALVLVVVGAGACGSGGRGGAWVDMAGGCPVAKVGVR